MMLRGLDGVDEDVGVADDPEGEEEAGGGLAAVRVEPGREDAVVLGRGVLAGPGEEREEGEDGEGDERGEELEAPVAAVVLGLELVRVDVPDVLEVDVDDVGEAAGDVEDGREREVAWAGRG